MSVLKFRNGPDSEWEDIAAIVGPQGPQGPRGSKYDDVVIRYIVDHSTSPAVNTATLEFGTYDDLVSKLQSGTEITGQLFLPFELDGSYFEDTAYLSRAEINGSDLVLTFFRTDDIYKSDTSDEQAVSVEKHVVTVKSDNSATITSSSVTVSSGGSVDVGYECTTSFTELFSESGATTKEEGGDFAQHFLDYANYIDVDEIKVVFNGTEYICPKMIKGTSVAYGSSTSDFEDYPFTLSSASNLNVLYTSDLMDFEITVFVPVTTATVTPCFKTAVETVMNGKGVKVIHIEADEEEGGFVCDTSCDEITETIQNGGYVVAYYNGNFYNLDVTSGSTITFAKMDINTKTQKAEIKGFTFNTSDRSITYFPNYS